MTEKKRFWQPELTVRPVDTPPGDYFVEGVYLVDADGKWSILLDIEPRNPRKGGKRKRVELYPQFGFSSPGSWLQFLWLREKRIKIALNEAHGPYIQIISHPPWEDVKEEAKRRYSEERTSE